MCNVKIIERPPCLCASKPLLKMSFAYMQIHFYILACVQFYFCCLCASAHLLNCFFAGVQNAVYRLSLLLMCNKGIIE